MWGMKAGPGGPTQQANCCRSKFCCFGSISGTNRMSLRLSPSFLYSLCCEYEGNVSAMSDREFHYIKHRDSATDQDRFSTYISYQIK